jgi:hypothetical protein
MITKVVTNIDVVIKGNTLLVPIHNKLILHFGAIVMDELGNQWRCTSEGEATLPPSFPGHQYSIESVV